MSVALSTATPARAESIPGGELLSAFSNACKSHGVWVAGALGDSYSLMETLKKVKEDPDCVTIAGTMSNLSLLSNQIQKLQTMNDNQVEIAKLDAQEQELIAQLAMTTDPDAIKSINESLRSVQLSRASLVGGIKATEKYSKQGDTQSLATIVNTTNAVFNQISANQMCLKKNPQLLNSALTLTSSVGAAVTAINPALGIGLSAGADFLGSITETARKGILSWRIKKIAKGSTLLMAYQCAFETMSNRWCEIDDAQKFLEFKTRYRKTDAKDSSLVGALRLNDREVPVLLNWLQKIQVGAEAATSADASRQSNVYYRDADVKSAKSYASGILKEKQKLFDAIKDGPNADEDRWNLFRSVVETISGYTCGGRTSSFSQFSVMYDIYSLNYAPFYLLGFQDIPSNTNGSKRSFCEFSSLSDVQGKLGTGWTPNFADLISRYKVWNDAARERVNNELALVLQPDPLQLITSAYDVTENSWKLSTRNSILNMIAFLNENKPVQKSSTYDQLYNDTIGKLKLINEKLENVVLLKNLDAKTAVKEIFETAELQNGIILFQIRLQMIVRLSLYAYFDKMKPDEQNAAAQLLAADRFADVLSKMKGTDNEADIKSELKSSKEITVNNLYQFTNTFAAEIRQILKYLIGQENKALQATELKKPDLELAETYRFSRAKLCYGILTSPFWPTRIKTEYCDGLQFNNGTIPNSPQAPKITTSLMNDSFEKRVCIMRDYSRNSKLFKDWGIILPQKP